MRNTCNVSFEARSDILSMKLMNGVAMVSLPWQPHCALLSGAGDRDAFVSSCKVFVIFVRF
jgi:hypothetical protein